MARSIELLKILASAKGRWWGFGIQNNGSLANCAIVNNIEDVLGCLRQCG